MGGDVSPSESRVGIHSDGHIRLIESLAYSHLAETEYSDLEKAAFEHGYLSGVSDSLAVIGSGMAAVNFIVVCLLPSLYTRIRDKLRPLVVARVAKEREWVKLFQRFHYPVLDTVHSAISYTCGVLFYITFLPFLFWIGEARLARQLTLLMATCIYVGNAIKDLICAPRPDWGKGIRLPVALEGAQEYGMPSTHTINTLCLIGYLLHHYNWHGFDGITRHPQGRYLYENMEETTLQWVFGAAIGWCLFVMWGRMYLGMHSPIDIVAGVIVAAAILAFWIAFEDFTDAWMTQGYMVPLYQVAFDVLLLFAYPVPLQWTPSYVPAVYFIGTSCGVICGVWFGYSRFHDPAAVAVTLVARGNLLSAHGAAWAGKRFVVGLIIVLVLRQAAKEIAERVIPVVAAVLGIECSAHEELGAMNPSETPVVKISDKGGHEDKGNTPPVHPRAPVGLNTRTGVRMATYTVVGWAVVWPVFYVFEVLGL